MKGLEGKIAIVTGSSRGIGRAISVRLSKEGCKVVINYSEDLGGAKETQKLCGSDSLIVKADVSKTDECQKLVNAAIEKFGKIDILVNNAGVFDRKSLDDINEEDWERIIGINSKSIVFCSKYAVPHMKNGAIVNVASVAAFRSRPNRTLYAASKSAIVGMTQALAMELAPSIRVNAVAPGLIETDLIEHVHTSTEEMKKRVMSIPLNRIGQPEDVANVVVFLASDEASYLTGTTVFIDGGVSIVLH